MSSRNPMPQKPSRSFTVKGYWLYPVLLLPWAVGVVTIIRWMPWP